MDVRCEKCQTEYELDESRLKPGGVTVKCTNCGHMFKIRKRSNTNVGVPTTTGNEPRQDTRPRTVSSRPPPQPPVTHTSATVAGPAPNAPTVVSLNPTAPLSALQDEAGGGTVRAANDLGSGPTPERQWLIRLENGEQKNCRELATLQQWIVAGIVSRESLISRTGKTWKRLGDITELGQYFVIADDAKAQRTAKPTGPKPAAKPLGQTVLGVGTRGPLPAGEDEDLERRTTGSYRARPKTPPPPIPAPARATAPKPVETAQTELSPTSPTPLPTPPPAPAVSAAEAPAVPPASPRRPPTQPPPPPRPKSPSAGERNTGGWAAADIKASDSMIAMPQGPSGGKLAAISSEPAFAGRVRVEPADEASFSTGKVRVLDDDDAVLPGRRGSRAGMWIAIVSLLVIAGAAITVYLVVFRAKTDKSDTAQKPPADAAQVAAAKADAAPAVVTAIVDAALPPSPAETARLELASGVEARIKPALELLAAKDEPTSFALRARMMTAIAQSMQDRAGLGDKTEGDKLRKDAKQLVVDAATLAQKAFKAQADDPAANLAMADVLRLQGKSARDVRRYLDTARGKAAADAELVRAIALVDAQTWARDGKLDDAAKALAGIDAAGDARVMMSSALVAYAQGKPDAARPFVDQILSAQAEHETARALQKKLDTTVVKTDPLPPEDGGHGSAAPSNHGSGAGHPTPPSGGGDYDALVASANNLAESNCTKAMELYQKALDIKSNGVEALTGMGYCHLDAKQFASAFSNFRSALMVSPKFEQALGGIAETYQRQGNKEQAIESWKRYLDVYPNSPKAKKQLELLGAGGAAPGPGNGDTSGGSAAPAPTPTPTPTPTPAPATEGSGSG